MQKNSKKFVILHPILIALFPVFLVYSQNIHLILIQGIIFPNEKYYLLYDDITPVNSFRIIFDSHFQTNLGIVEDKVFFSTYEKPYTLIEITDFSIVG